MISDDLAPTNFAIAMSNDQRDNSYSIPIQIH